MEKTAQSSGNDFTGNQLQLQLQKKKKTETGAVCLSSQSEIHSSCSFPSSFDSGFFDSQHDNESSSSSSQPSQGSQQSQSQPPKPATTTTTTSSITVNNDDQPAHSSGGGGGISDVSANFGYTSIREKKPFDTQLGQLEQLQRTTTADELNSHSAQVGKSLNFVLSSYSSFFLEMIMNSVGQSTRLPMSASRAGLELVDTFIASAVRWLCTEPPPQSPLSLFLFSVAVVGVHLLLLCLFFTCCCLHYLLAAFTRKEMSV